ncbi:HesA/MoeB/ThiF family protein [Actinoplanes sp. G11-F43]|uniref:HesA/MoeB/ThiF family protein n=1 Tax=Actinoplanes sp. G11-F43 TaxID=3424130 RepID=UPI003D34F810
MKPEHGLFRMPDGRVRIGGSVYGVAAEVDDPRGLVWTMLSAAAGPPSQLSPREQQRYDRGRQFHRWLDMRRRDNSWEPQLRLKQARVTVLGLGGTGGTVALALAASGVGRIHCVDADVVELSNLNRQTQFDETDIGRPKADVTAGRLRRLNSDIEVTSERLTVTEPAQLPALVRRPVATPAVTDH